MRLVYARELGALLDAFARQGRRTAVFSRHAVPALPNVIAVQAPDKAVDYARAMYAALRRLDEADAEMLLVEAVPNAPQWLAVRDRLARAAQHDLADDEP